MTWWNPATWGRRSTLANPAPWLTEAFGASPSASGITVTETTALGTAAVYACVRVLADSIAQLPIKVQRITGGARDDDPRHPLYSLLHDLPNPEMTAFELKHVLQQHLALWGNAYCEVERDGLGRVVALWPLNPAQMTVDREPGTLAKRWSYRLPNGAPVVWTWANPTRVPSPIVHLRGLGDGHVGYSPLRLMRESIGRTIATEEYGARLFSNSASPRGYLAAPGRISPDAAARLKERWETAHRGLTNAHRVAVLEEGLTWHQIGLNSDDAQFIETRKLNVTDIARAFRVPPHLIADLERATFSNIEHQAIDFVVHSLTPWVVCWEQGLARDLLSVKGYSTHQIKMHVQGLLRGDIQSRYAAYAIGRNWGWLSADDVRRLEDLNPLPDGQGEQYLIPLNMTPANQPTTAAPMPAPLAPTATDDEVTIQ